MATTTLGAAYNPASVSDRIQTYFSKQLLAIQQDNLVMDQFGITEDLPKNAGAKTLRFFKPAKANTGPAVAAGLYGLPTDANIIQALTEAVAPSSYRENDWTKVDCVLKQYGAVTKISDLTSIVDAFKPLKQNIELLGRDAALHVDTVTRNSLVGSNHPESSMTVLTHNSGASAALYGSEIFVSGANTYQPTNAANASAASFAAALALTQANGKITRLGILTAITRLRVKKAPTFSGGMYVGLVCPQVMQDIYQDSSYANAFQGRGSDGIYKGEVFNVDGCRVVLHTNPFIENDTYGTYANVDSGTVGLVYSTLFLGRGAYGVPKLAGTTSPLRPQIFINDKPDKSDPLNQFVIAGWKAYYMAVGLDPDNIAVLRTKATYA